MSHVIRCFVILCAVALACTGAVAAAGFDFATTPGSLPKDVRPIEHVVQLVPDIAAHTFRGHQSVQIDVLAPVQRIVMHGFKIEVDGVTLRGQGLPRLRLGAPAIDGERQLLAFELPRVLRPGRYTLEMDWRGQINATAEGLYLQTFPAPDGPRTLLATQMEPTSARRLLPCWDEPAFRTRFRLSIDLPAGWTATSNMPPVVKRSLAGGGTRTGFAPTPAMASYLLAVVAGQTERLDDEVDSTRLGIVVTAGKLGGAGYAMAATRQILPYYNDYFGQRYPLPKLDQIAVPGGFGGGMENWGAIVYNEPIFLVDPATTPERTRLTVFGVVAHEIAHQWFGNLVTMGWWDDLWLNEAFAEWMGLKATDRFLPEWRIRLDAIAGRERAMDLDARATTHPIRQPIESDAEATSAFDFITYEKGAAFLHMTESWLGEAAFRDGIRRYMAAHRYGNTTGADLWAALDQASGQPVGDLAADWTTQPGFPLVSVDARCERGRRVVSLSQEAFRSDSRAGAASPRWRTPVRLEAGASAATTLLRDAAASVELPGCDGDLLVDPGNVGYFRVRYAPPLFAALAGSFAGLPDAARLKLLADTSALVRADRVPLADWLALLPALRDEPRNAVWTRLIDDLHEWDRLLADEPSHAAISRFAAALIKPRLAALGWDEKPGESVEDRALRGQLVLALVRHDDPEALAESRVRFERYLVDRKTLPSAMLEAVLRGVGREADAAIWERMKTLADTSLVTEEKFRWYRALAQARDPSLATRAMALSLAPEVPPLMRQEMLAKVAAAGHQAAAWAFAREHAPALLLDVTQHGGGRYFGSIVETSASPALADELEAFVQAQLPESAQIDARRTGDEIRTRARLKARLQAALEKAAARS